MILRTWGAGRPVDAANTYPRRVIKRIVLSCIALLVTAPAFAGPRLQAEVDALVRSAPKAKLTVLVVDAASGEEIYAHEPRLALVPASNMKLLTTATALARLGPKFVHTTRVVLAGRVQGGRLDGDLVVVGGGDPTISARFDKDPLLGEIAAAVAAAGVKEISGDMVADDRAFDDVRLHPEWEDSDAEHWYGAEVSALTLNDGCLDVSVSGGASAPTVSLRPRTDYVKLDVRAKLIPTSKGHSFSFLRTGKGKRTLRISGKVWRKAKPYTGSVPVRQPSLFFATVLREQLTARGVRTVGETRRAKATEQVAGQTVWERKAPLPRTLKVTNQRSQNLYAECLLKTLGRLKGGELQRGGSWKAGAKVAEAYAKAVGAKGVTVSDGSGLSRGNRLSARAVVTVMRAAASGPHGELYRESLAQPGQPGTLRRRLKGLPVTLRAKTGTLTGVAALSGFLESCEKRWAFSIVMNGKGTSKRVLDRIVKVLAGHLQRS